MVNRQPRRRQVVFVGSKIRQLRKEHNMTQADLAQRIGVQQSDLCRMENGEYKVSLDTMFKILSVFGVDIGDFFREDCPPLSADEAERELVRLYRVLDEHGRDEVLDFVRYKGQRTGEAWKR